MEDTDEHHNIHHAGPAVGPAADAGDDDQHVLMSSDPSSLLELLLLQRTGGETGVRYVQCLTLVPVLRLVGPENTKDAAAQGCALLGGGHIRTCPAPKLSPL